MTEAFEMSERNQPMPLPEMAMPHEDKHLIADMIPICLTMVQKAAPPRQSACNLPNTRSLKKNARSIG
jgi:hypothetical protein